MLKRSMARLSGFGLLAFAACAGRVGAEGSNCPKVSAQPCIPSVPSSSPAQPPPPLAGTPPSSDEGMWLLEDFPVQRLKDKYGFAPTKEWLDHVRLSSIRFPGGCSGSFVSPRGLVMTNHHCVHHCVQQISNKKNDHVANGFQAARLEDEVPCPAMEINQLVEIKDVTGSIEDATRGMPDKEANDAKKAEMSRIEKACATSDSIRCDVVTLYHGGRYHLYKYKRYQDVRLVFAPELSIAFFGGDPDNFNFPRYDLDTSFVRVYENGKPAATDQYFKWSKAGAGEGELTFVSGHPGSTSRLLTVAELEYVRDEALPPRLMRLAEARGVLSEFQKLGQEQKRISSSRLFGVENAIKALRGRWHALLDPAFFARKASEERAIRSRVDADPRMKAAYGSAWDAIAAAQKRKREIRAPYIWLEQGWAFWSDLAEHARTLVRAAEELPKPDGTRLREFSDSHLPEIKQELLASAPIYDDLEIVTLTLSLTQMREALGVDHPAVRKLLGKDAPATVAARLVKGTRLKDVAFRKKLLEGGKPVVDASNDPMIAFMRAIDAEARAVRKDYEDNVEAVEKKNSELIAKARFELLGTSEYPDATFTLRLSYGQVRGWVEGGQPVKPFTTIGGAFERHTGAEPFALPKSWLDARSRLDLDTPFNFVTTNDIIGGNSGSPVINKDAEIVGLIFDGNIHSLGGDYYFDEASNRAVALHSSAILEALDKVYHATRLRDELTPR